MGLNPVYDPLLDPRKWFDPSLSSAAGFFDPTFENVAGASASNPVAPPWRQFSPSDDAVWTGRPTFTLPALRPLLPSRWNFHVWDEPAWTGQSRFSLPALLPFNPLPWRFNVIDETQAWIGKPSFYQPSVVPVFPTQWRFNIAEEAVWIGTPSKIPLTEEATPFFATRWRFNLAEDTPWLGAPSKIPLTEEATPLAPTQWRFNYSEDAVWLPQPTRITLANPFLPAHWRFNYTEDATGPIQRVTGFQLESAHPEIMPPTPTAWSFDVPDDAVSWAFWTGPSRVLHPPKPFAPRAWQFAPADAFEGTPWSASYSQPIPVFVEEQAASGVWRLYRNVQDAVDQKRDAARIAQTWAEIFTKDMDAIIALLNTGDDAEDITGHLLERIAVALDIERKAAIQREYDEIIALYFLN